MTLKSCLLTSCISIFLVVTMVSLVIPVAGAEDDYLDDGFLGLPSWAYIKLDQVIMNDIIGTIRGHTLFGPQEDIEGDADSSFKRNMYINPRMKNRIFG